MPLQDLTKLTPEQLVDAAGQPGSQQSLWVEFEFMRRQTVAQIEAAEAQERAASAAEETAVYTRRNAFWMLLSVVVLTLSSLATFVLALLTYLRVPPA
jgi:hypothetical protein